MALIFLIWETSIPSQKSILFKNCSELSLFEQIFLVITKDFQLFLTGGQKYYKSFCCCYGRKCFLLVFLAKMFDSLNFHKWKNYGSLDVESAVGMLNGSGIPEWSDQMVNFWWLLRVFPKRGGRGKFKISSG